MRFARVCAAAALWVILFEARAVAAPAEEEEAADEEEAAEDKLPRCRTPSASRPDKVTIPLRGGFVDGFKFSPAGGGHRYPAIIALHGCAGMWTACRDKHDKPIKQMTARFDAWAAHLVERGYVVLFTDDFPTDQCGTKEQDRNPNTAQRAERAWDVATWLAREDDVDPNHLALLGWSHGAQAVLAGALRSKQAPKTRKFRAMIAFYPGCGSFSREHLDPADWEKSPRVLVLTGAKDDWTRAKYCERLADKVPLIEHVPHANAYHGFDGPGNRVCLRTGLAGDRIAHFGGNRVARKQARSRVRARLLAAFSGPYSEQYDWSLEHELSHDLEQGVAPACQEPEDWCEDEFFDEAFLAAESEGAESFEEFELLYLEKFAEESDELQAEFDAEEDAAWKRFEAGLPP